MSVEKVMDTVDLGPVQLAVIYHDQDGKRLQEHRQPQQGIRLTVQSRSGDEIIPILQFDLFDAKPCYRYCTEGGSETVDIDPISAGNTLNWSFAQLKSRLPEMLAHAGRAELACSLDGVDVAAAYRDQLSRAEATAREALRKWRRTVTHNGSAELANIPNASVFEAGNIRFGLEFRTLASIDVSGVGIHVLSDVAGQEIELLAFDCFNRNAHYHYGPRNKDFRVYWDRAVVPDPLRWTMARFKEGKLADMIAHAGYPTIARDLDTELLDQVIREELEPAALALQDGQQAAA